jgi:hypothetical protein
MLNVPLLNVILLGVFLLSVILLNVFTLNVVALFFQPSVSTSYLVSWLVSLGAIIILTIIKRSSLIVKCVSSDWFLKVCFFN